MDEKKLLTTPKKEEREIYDIFIMSLLIKGLTATLEIIGGILLWFPGVINKVVGGMIHLELIEDRFDFLSTPVHSLLLYFSSSARVFASFYLLFHGVIKLFLIFNLLRKRLWAYPATIIVFGLFTVYEAYRFTQTHSIFLIILSIFDLFVIILTAHEYKMIKKIFQSQELKTLDK